MSRHHRSDRFERAVRYVLALQRGQAINAPWITGALGVSLAQAKRDLLEIERLLPVRRERGVLRLVRPS